MYTKFGYILSINSQDIEQKLNSDIFRFVSLLLNVPVNNFSVMSGWRHPFLGITSTFGKYMYLAQGHNMAT